MFPRIWTTAVLLANHASTVPLHTGSTGRKRHDQDARNQRPVPGTDARLRRRRHAERTPRRRRHRRRRDSVGHEELADYTH